MNGNGKYTRRSSKKANLDLQAKISAVRALNLEAALRFYGVEFDRRGFACCPLHREKTASFKVHNNKFKCFGCGATGDLIDFVSMRNGLSFGEAVSAICRDFRIDAAPTMADLERYDETRLEKSRNRKEYQGLLANKNELHALFLACNEICDVVAQLPGGKTASNELYVNALFNLMEASSMLTEAEFACIDFARAHPDVLTVPPKPMEFPDKLEWSRRKQTILPFDL